MRAAALQAIAQGWGGNAQALAFLRDRAINDPDRTRARPRCRPSRKAGEATPRPGFPPGPGHQ